MVHVRLAQDWTDGGGTAHAAGETVDVDAGTLAELEASGVVLSPGDQTDWPGPTAMTTTSETEKWPGPTGGEGTDWPGPTV